MIQGKPSIGSSLSSYGMDMNGHVEQAHKHGTHRLSHYPSSSLLSICICQATQLVISSLTNRSACPNNHAECSSLMEYHSGHRLEHF